MCTQCVTDYTRKCVYQYLRAICSPTSLQSGCCSKIGARGIISFRYPGLYPLKTPFCHGVIIGFEPCLPLLFFSRCQFDGNALPKKNGPKPSNLYALMFVRLLSSSSALSSPRPAAGEMCVFCLLGWWKATS